MKIDDLVGNELKSLAENCKLLDQRELDFWENPQSGPIRQTESC